MAEFNPKVQDVGTTNYINYSSRSSGNQGWGTLFEGLVKGADKMIQRNLKQQVNEAFAGADAQLFGQSGETAQPGNDTAAPAPSTGQDNEVKPMPPTVPKPLKDGLDDMSTLTKAKDAGVFSERNYYTQVESRLKQLRAQFPGYNDYIDAYTSDAMQSPTANILRKIAFSEMEAARSSAQAQLNNDYEVIGKSLYLLNPEEQAMYSNRSLPDDLRFKLKVRATQEEADRQGVDALKGKADLAARLRETNQAAAGDAEDASFKYAYGAVSQMFYKAYNQGLGRDGSGIKALQDAVTAAKADGNISPDEIKSIQAMGQPLIAQLRYGYETILNEPTSTGKSFAQTMKPDDVEKVRKHAEDQIAMIEKAMGGDISILDMNSKMLTAQRDSVAFQVYKTDGGQIALQLGALAEGSKGALTPYLQGLITKNEGVDGTIDSLTAQIFKGEILTNATPLDKLVDQGTGEIPPAALKAATRDALENGVKIITDDKVPIEQRANAVLALYGESGLEFMRKLDDTPDKFGLSSRERVWRMMSSPEVYAKVKEIGKTNPKALEDYQTFMMNALPSVFKDSADSLQDAQVWSKYASARFDTTSGQWVVDIDETKFKDPATMQRFLRGEGMETLAPTISQRIELQKVRDMVASVKRLNGVMITLKPMLDDMGVKNQPEVLLQVLGGVDLNAEKKQPLLDWLKESVSNAVSTAMRAGEVKPGQEKVTTPGGIEVGVSKDELNAVTPAPVTDEFNGGLEFKGLGKQGMILPEGTKVEPASYTVEGDTSTQFRFTNQRAIRSREIQPELRRRLGTAVQTVLGDGYTVEVYSGGQPKKGEKGPRTGSRRHDHGNAADVRIFGPDGKQIKDRKVLDRLVDHWISTGQGSAGKYMSGMGIHFDLVTQDQLRAGEALTWNY